MISVNVSRRALTKSSIREEVGGRKRRKREGNSRAFVGFFCGERFTYAVCICLQ